MFLFLVTDEVLENSIKWLETNQEPWSMVLSHWKSTSSHRLNDIRRDNSKTLSEIFKKWPILYHPMSWSLILQDFKYLELCTVDDAISQWPQFFQNVQKVCPLEKKKNVRAQELLNILESDLSDGTRQYYFTYKINILYNFSIMS